MNELLLLKDLYYNDDSQRRYTFQVYKFMSDSYQTKYYEKYANDNNCGESNNDRKSFFTDFLNDLEKINVLSIKEVDAEVIRFKCKFIYDTVICEIDVYDTLSPNRWYDLPEEENLDSTPYEIVVNIIFIEEINSAKK